MAMRLGGWLTVVVIASCATGCQCFVPVSDQRDGGVVDGGALDAGALDGGALDGGALDAGALDAGALDAGALDAGALDAGVLDAGVLDAGVLDAGVLDAGALDAGALDAGGPERCNGFDDDGDGRIDQSLDGGLITLPCPLTLGVCAGHVSVCIDGGFSACDYGPSFQTTERNCDGLDNDCDGRVDRSWTRVLWEADGGHFTGPCSGVDDAGSDICYGDIIPAQVFVEPNGLLLSTERHFARLSNDLRVQSDSLAPSSWAHAATFRDGAGWLRILTTNINNARHRGFAMYALDADGGFAVEPDGGIRFLSAYFPDLQTSGGSVTEVDGGFEIVLVGAGGVSSEPLVARVTHVRFERDGGLSTTSRDFDAGVTFGLAYDTPAVTGGNLAMNWWPNPPYLIGFCDTQTLSCAPLAGPWTSYNWCVIAGGAPLVLGCERYPSTTTWFTFDGGTIFSSDAGPSLASFGVSRSGPNSDRIFAAALVDAGIELFVVRSAGITTVGVTPRPPPGAGPQLFQLNSDLHLMITTEGQTGTFPSGEFDRVNAEYVCVPQ